jgi:hypothetical protein
MFSAAERAWFNVDGANVVCSKFCCPDEHKLWPDWLRKIDTLLEDEGVIEVVARKDSKRGGRRVAGVGVLVHPRKRSCGC